MLMDVMVAKSATGGSLLERALLSKGPTELATIVARLKICLGCPLPYSVQQVQHFDPSCEVKWNTHTHTHTHTHIHTHTGGGGGGGQGGNRHINRMQVRKRSSYEGSALFRARDRRNVQQMCGACQTN